ncbi:carbohydrate ABC transporter permease [Spirochaeta isovalerica]|uniref:Raffinose/stachyose/melibiose transport system permease protein n=1 Tax=Spirochaeta isovalerica TaxID=150 RepID=A0A841R7S9_9SPIO|nr:carbohydrate ABC transporter permease [Spirochaeta isovalerica]MBB6479913.1 raffinose/stachyose/melibiose transport system permease protein [Spirochaeta isovalerica]
MVTKKRYEVIRFVFSAIIAFLMFYPILTVLMGGFKEKGQIFSDPFGIPNPPTLQTFAEILGATGTYWTLIFNSVYITGATIAIVIVFAMLASAALSRIRIKGQKAIFNFFIMGLLFPLTVAILPLFLQLRSFGLIGSRWGVILTQAAFNLPISIFILTGFFRQIPFELQDACSIDGGTILTFFRKIMVPLSTPVLATVTIIVFVASWNQFMLPLLVLSDTSHFTIPLGVMQYQGQYASGWNQIMAFITLSILPVIIFYFALQRYVIDGLTAGAVKG